MSQPELVKHYTLTEALKEQTGVLEGCWKTAMNLIHLFLALFPACLNAVITASGSACGENVAPYLFSSVLMEEEFTSKYNSKKKNHLLCHCKLVWRVVPIPVKFHGSLTVPISVLEQLN